MKREFNSPPPTAREVHLADAVLDASDALEKSARAAFVVCGQPVEKLAFEEVWQREDPQTFWLWFRLKNRALSRTDEPTTAEALLTEALNAHDTQAPKWSPAGWFERVRAYLQLPAQVTEALPIEAVALGAAHDPASLEQGDAA